LNKKHVPKTLLLLAILVVALAQAYPSSDEVSASAEQFPVAIYDISIENVLEHAEYLSSLGSRVTGYPGFYDAARYIENKLLEYGLVNVTSEGYEVAVPLDEGSFIELPNGTRISAYALWPLQANPCTTPPSGVSGPAYYVGKGSMEELNGVPIEGSIVVMDFDCNFNWLTVASLGAKAVVFVPKGIMTRGATELHKLDGPMYFPRLMVYGENSSKLLSLVTSNPGINLTVHVNMAWRKVKGVNVFGLVEGTDPALKNEIVVLCAHFDSWCVTPGFAPGATDALNAAVLLELARHISENPQKRTVMVLFLSGHYQSLSGARWFVEKHYFNYSDSEVGSPDGYAKRIVAAIGVELSPSSRYVMPLHFGYFYSKEALLRTETTRKRNLPAIANDYLRPLLDELLNRELLPREYLEYYAAESVFESFADPDTWELLTGIRYWLDTEVFSTIGLFSLTMFTIHDARIFRYTPFDNFTLVEASSDNLDLQIKLSTAVVNVFLNDESLSNVIKPTEGHRMGGGGKDEMFSKMYGYVALWNETEGWLSEPEDIKALNLAPFLVYVTYTAPWLHNVHYVVLTDDYGRFNLTGIQNWVIGRSAVFTFSIYHFTNDGAIDYVINTGTKVGGFPPTMTNLDRPVYGSPDNPRPFPVFKCGTAIFYHVADPRTLLDPAAASLKGLLFGPGISAVGLSFTYEVLDAISGSTPQNYSLQTDSLGNIYLFSSSDFRLQVKIGMYGIEHPLALLINATEERPKGSGFQVEEGEYLLVHNTYLKIVEDMQVLTRERLEALVKENAVDPSAEEKYERSLELYEKAVSCLERSDYSGYYRYVIEAFAEARKAYVASRSALMDVINTIVFYFLTLIPFAFLFERLVLHVEEGSKRIVAIAATFMVCMLLLNFLHPGFKLASNVILTFVSLVMFIFTIPALLLVFSFASNFLKEYRRKKLGVHVSEVSKLSATLISFSFGIGNMRKRKLRTALTLTTITIIVLGLVSFTSLSTFTITMYPTKKVPVAYDGILIERMGSEGLLPLSHQLVSYLEARYGANATISYRYWSSMGSGGWLIYISPARCMEVAAKVDVILGATPLEPKLTRFNETLISSEELGNSSWFKEDDYFCCIVSDTIYREMNRMLSERGLPPLKVGDKLVLRGVELTLKGVFNASKARMIKDLDQGWITPIIGRRTHGEPESMVIIPWKLARDNLWSTSKYGISFFLAQVNVVLEGYSAEQIKKEAKELSEVLQGLEIVAGMKEEQEVVYVSVLAARTVSGYDLLFIPLLIAVLTILNTMLASVYERVREIGILNAVGLSPLHISALFFAESLLYAVVGAVIGYLSGMVLIKFIVAGLLPAAVRPSFSSTMVVLSVSLAMLAVVASAIYPSLKASRISLPSLKRRWEMPTKPVGDHWEIPLPFVAASEREIRGLLLFLKEYMSAYTSEQIGDFIARNIALKDNVLEAEVQLKPWHAGIHQKVKLYPVKETETRWNFKLEVDRLGGNYKLWQRSNRMFVDNLRKQFLIWRGLSAEEKKRYVE